MFPLPCVIFAGGKSSRMGEDKSLLPFGGFSTLSEFQYNRLSSLFDRVYISAKSADKFSFHAPFLLDLPDMPYAPTAGFVSAFSTLNDERFFALSVDTPFVDKNVFQTLIHADDDSLDAVIAKTANGTHPLCGIYHRSLAQNFKKMAQENDHRLGKLLASSHTRYEIFEDENLFANLNHPHEYSEALSRYNKEIL